jgi:hypothetical protein
MEDASATRPSLPIMNARFVRKVCKAKEDIVYRVPVSPSEVIQRVSPSHLERSTLAHYT